MFQVTDDKNIVKFGKTDTKELLYKKITEVLNDDEGMNKLQVECIICLASLRLLLLSPNNIDKCKLVLDNVYDSMVDLSDQLKANYDEWLRRENDKT